ncbi:unnamed protein product [Anisakis simplex]|uniref:Carboxylic ester hydrolase n=1 Tax=Anisakis simplex TaxID=6269 RepID=A0A0M3K7H3_ANISI|nr:unnamed protein product [Anisakis simplex]
MGNLIGRHFVETNLTSNVVKIASGEIVGKKFDVGDGRFVDAFLGIPFAKAPVGELRYQKPQAPDSWDNIRECKKHGPRAPQKTLVLEKLSMRIPSNEDCLYLNVFAPEPLTGDGRAVMVFVHGGGFAMHTSANYGDFGDENCIPNLGLWDQTFALHWVKDNIRAFGGNPDNMTVFGQSAGAASVDMLCVSPHSRDLFNKVVAMSGSAYCEWATNTADNIVGEAMKRAKAHGWSPPKNGSDEEIKRSLMEFLKKEPCEHLSLGIIPARKKLSRQGGLIFVPIIDGDFLPEPIAELRKKIPKKLCMTGTTELEGLLFTALGGPQFKLGRLKQLIPDRITQHHFADYEQLRKEALSLYMKNGDSKKQSSYGYVKLLSDLYITNAVHDFAEDMNAAGHTVYLYSFEHCNSNDFGLVKCLFPFKASTHATELPYLFAHGLIAPFKPNEADKKVVENFTTLFTNFAKYGDPNGVDGKKLWEPLSENDTYKYLCIKETMTMKNNYEERRATFWRNLKNRQENSTDVLY